jgi:hypothetical protein
MGSCHGGMIRGGRTHGEELQVVSKEATFEPDWLEDHCTEAAAGPVRGCCSLKVFAFSVLQSFSLGYLEPSTSLNNLLDFSIYS